MRNRILASTGCLILLLSYLAAEIPIAGADEIAYGAPVDGHPSWRERVFLVLTNACRTDPEGFRDRYLLLPSSILTPAVYPPVPPAHWDLDLNRSARFHAIEMASQPGCPFGHNSCDGTLWNERIESFYTESEVFSENLAAGASDALQMLRLLIEDRFQGVPAPDASCCDGHRKNIMNSSYRELGCGYSNGPNTFHHYWVQDFGGGGMVFDHRVAAGTHTFLAPGKTTFIASYHDPAGNPPQEAKLILAGQEHALALDLGTADMGTYLVELDSGTACRAYHFLFVDGDGKEWRYPASGELATTGEGDCAEEYSNPIPTGLQRPGDCSGDGTVDISDAVCLLGFLFLGEPDRLPCGAGNAFDAENITLLDANGDAGLDLADPIYLLEWIFLGGPAHSGGTACIEIPGCDGFCGS